MPTYPQNQSEATLLEQILDRLTNLERANPLVNASIPDGGIQIEGNGSIRSSNFDGDITTGALGTNGVAMGGPLGALFVNEIFLRGGIIGNDALTSPADFGANGQAGLAFAVSASPSVVVTRTIAVPAGYSRAIVHATGHLSAVEANGLTDYLYFTVLINGTGSADVFAKADPNQPAHVSNSSVRALTGLSGGVITFQGQAWASGASWSAQGPNVCTINATATFLR